MRPKIRLQSTCPTEPLNQTGLRSPKHDAAINFKTHLVGGVQIALLGRSMLNSADKPLETVINLILHIHSYLLHGRWYDN